MKDVLGTHKAVEYLAVVVSGLPNHEEGEVIEVVEIESSTGAAQAEAVWSVLKKCGAVDNVRGLLFDTTASNTGCHSGAAVRLLKSFEKPKLYFECRHHVPELIIKAVWNELFGEDPSGEIKDFATFKDMWPYIDKSNPKKLNILPGFEEDLKAENVSFLNDLLSNPGKKGLPRDDYLEAARLTLFLLGGDVPGMEKMVFWAPGATHKARFMAKMIYGLKMFAFSDLNLDHDLLAAEKPRVDDLQLGEGYLDQLERFVRFVCLLYSAYWFKAPVGVEAPMNDLDFYHKLLKYRLIDEGVADAALSVLNRHLFYLTQELTVFTLFSNKVHEDEKSELAAKLISSKKPETWELKKPATPLLTPDTKLKDLIGPKSWLLFKVLDVNVDWLLLDPKEWKKYPAYQEAEQFVRSCKVVNDGSERGVKLIQDYCDKLTKSSEKRKFLLKAVQASRAEVKDMSKASLNKLS